MSLKSGQYGASSVAVLLLAVYSSEALVNPLTVSFASASEVWSDTAGGIDQPVSGDALAGSPPARDADDPKDDDESQISVRTGPLWSRPVPTRRQVLLVTLAGLPPWHHGFGVPVAPGAPRVMAGERAVSSDRSVVDPNHRCHAPPEAV